MTSTSEADRCHDGACDIATLTGWSTTAIRKALQPRPTATNTTNGDTGDDTGDGDLVEAAGTDAAAEGSVA